MPRIRPANSNPKPSRKKARFRPSAGIHGQLASTTPPSKTVGASPASSTSASAVGVAAAHALAVRPARTSTGGSTMPASGSNTINRSFMSSLYANGPGAWPGVYRNTPLAPAMPPACMRRGAFGIGGSLAELIPCGTRARRCRRVRPFSVKVMYKRWNGRGIPSKGVFSVTGGL